MGKSCLRLSVVLALVLLCGSGFAATMYVAKWDGGMGTLGPITAWPGQTITIGA